MEFVTGCAITGIVPASGAAESTLRQGDVVLAIDGTPVGNFPELQECIARYHPGDVVHVLYARDGSTSEADVQLKSRAGQIAFSDDASSDDRARDLWLKAAKAGLSPVAPSVASELGTEGGAQVTSLAVENSLTPESAKDSSSPRSIRTQSMVPLTWKQLERFEGAHSLKVYTQTVKKPIMEWL